MPQALENIAPVFSIFPKKRGMGFAQGHPVDILLLLLLFLLLLRLICMLRLGRVLLSVLLLSPFSTACLEYKVHEIKDFRIFVDTDEPRLQRAIEVLAQRYNEDAGTKALKIVKDRSLSNSSITFIQDLNNDDGHKLGLAQWVTSSSEKNSIATQGPRKSVTIKYGMQIEFDRENFLIRADMVDDQNSNEFQHLYHLFCHEVGHGMQMDHSNDNRNVMYKSIPDTTVRAIDFKGYFNAVRSFMNVPVARQGSGLTNTAGLD